MGRQQKLYVIMALIMRRVTEALSKHLGSVIVYEDDIRQLMDVVSELSCNARIKIDHWELENVDELSSLSRISDRFNDLEITCFTECMQLEIRLSAFDSWVYIGSDDLASTGAFEKIVRILKRRQRSVAHFLIPDTVFNRSIIYPSRKKAKPSFWERNGDRILLVVVSALATVMCTLLVQWLIKRLF